MSDEDPGKTFTQDDLTRIVNERTKSMRAELAKRDKEIASLTKDRDEYKTLSDGKDALAEQLKQAHADLEAKQATWGKEKILGRVLGDAYDDGTAEFLIGRHAKTKDAGDFAEWVEAKADAREGVWKNILGPKADPVPENGAGAPVVPSAPSLPNIPTPPAMNGGAAGTPPAAPAFSPGSYAQAPAAEWASIAAGYGIKVKNT
jgi:hypothetical protein